MTALAETASAPAVPQILESDAEHTEVARKIPEIGYPKSKTSVHRWQARRDDNQQEQMPMTKAPETVTEIVLGSEIQKKIVNRIYKMRNPDALMGEAYEAALAAYEEDRGDLPEADGTEKSGIFSYKSRGFYRLVDGKPEFTPRPRRLNPLAYSYRPYDKRMADSSRSFGGSMGHAKENGVLAGSEHNRDIRPDRVDSYAQAMVNGEWKDLLSDPITITDDGHVINGQHRIAAASDAWSGTYTTTGRDTVLPPNDPAFLVIWGVSPDEAALADGSRRTEHDVAVIARKARNRAA